MIFRIHISLVPIFTILSIIIVSSFNNGFLTKYNSIDDISPIGNPYINELVLENSEQKAIYQNRWFLPQSKKTVVYLMDDVPYYLVVDINKQKQYSESRKKDDRLYLEGKLYSVVQTLNNEQKNSVLLRSRSESYTMTTTRVKTFATGIIPGVIDVYQHVGQTAVKDDHIFMHTRAQNEKTYVFGTDTWEKFFGEFIDVKDIISVSDSRMHIQNSPIYQKRIVSLLNKDSKEKDWSLLLFHDSSFDTVMHSGLCFKFDDPFDNEVFNPAMDVLNKGALSFIENADEDVTIFLMSDHGFIKTTGEHGGLTDDEKNAFLFLYSKKGFIKDRKIGQIMDKISLNSTINQVDFVPTICLLKGIAIPSNNIGAIIPDAFLNLPWVTNTYIANAYYTNLRQIEDFFKKSYEEYESPSIETTNKIFNLIDKGKTMYNKLFQKNSSSQPSTTKLARFISHVRKISSTIIEAYTNEANIDYNQMKLATASIIILVILILVVQMNLDMMIYKGIKQNLIEPTQNTKIITACILLIIIVSSLISIYTIKKYLIALNIITIIVTFLLILYGIAFLFEIKGIQSVQSIGNQKHQFTIRFDVQTFIFLTLIGTYPIFLTSNDFIYALDSIYLLVIAQVLILISIHAAYISFTQKKITFFKVFIRAIIILMLLHITIYYDPNLLSNFDIEYHKFFVNQDYLTFICQPFFSLYLPVLSLVVFQIFRIYKCTKVLRQISKEKDSNIQIHVSHKAIWFIQSLNLLVCLVYFTEKTNNQDYKLFFSNFFPLSSYFLILLQLTLLCTYMPKSMNFFDKYKLFFWSLIPPFLYLMEQHSIIQIVIFFSIIILFQDILKLLNYRQHLFIYIFLSILCMSFYVSSGHGYRVYQVKFTASQLGVVYFNEIQVALNVLISNLSWFILVPLYFPILLQDDVNKLNAQNFSTSFILTNLQSQDEKYVDINNERNKEIDDSSGQTLTSLTQNQTISNLYIFQIKIIQNVLQYLLFFIVGFIPAFFHNIHSGYTPQTDIFTFIVLLFLMLIVIGTVFYAIFQLFSQKMFNSILSCQENKQISKNV